MTDDPIRRIARADALDEESVRPLFEAQTRLVKAAVVREIEHVHTQLDAARRKAEELVAEAEKQADGIRDAAAAEGRREGLEEVARHVAAAEKARAAARQSAEDDMLDLAFGLAERIVGRALQRDSSVFADLVADKLERVRGAPRVTIRVHPADLDDLKAQRQRLVTQVDGVPVQLEPDPALSRGDCVLETDRGRLDARLTTQLDEMKRALRRSDSDE